MKIECCLQKHRVDLFLVKFMTEDTYISTGELTEEKNTVPQMYDQKSCNFAGGCEDASCAEPGASWEESGAWVVVKLDKLRGAYQRDRDVGVQ